MTGSLLFHHIKYIFSRYESESEDDDQETESSGEEEDLGLENSNVKVRKKMENFVILKTKCMSSISKVNLGAVKYGRAFQIRIPGSQKWIELKVESNSVKRCFCDSRILFIRASKCPSQNEWEVIQSEDYFHGSREVESKWNEKQRGGSKHLIEILI